MKQILFLALAVIAIALGVVLGSPLARGVKEVQKTVPAAEARGQRELTHDQLENFPERPVYWLDEEFKGLKLVKIQYVRNVGSDVEKPAVEYVQAIYASCKPGHPAQGGSTEGYCPEGELPIFISVRTDRFCLNKPSFLSEAARRGRSFTIGKAGAQQTESGDLYLYTGGSTVIVSSSEGEGLAEEAAKNLKGANAIARRPDHAASGPPMREEDCAGFVLPDPPTIPTAVPTETPTAEPTGTPTVEPVALPTIATATIGPTPEATLVPEEGM